MVRVPEKGNGLIEMLMFMPLAMLLLFGVTDAGLSSLERARISDALRDALRDQGKLAETATVLRLNQHYGLQVDEEACQKAARSAADRLAVKAEQAKQQALGFFQAEFRAAATVVVLSIDESTGRALAIEHNCSHISKKGNPHLDLPSQAPAYRYRPEAEYMQLILEHEMAAAPSRFAVSLGPTYPVSGGAARPARYMPRAAFLYAGAEVLSQSVTPLLGESIFGSVFAVQEQAVVPLKAAF